MDDVEVMLAEGARLQQEWVAARKQVFQETGDLMSMQDGILRRHADSGF